MLKQTLLIIFCILALGSVGQDSLYIKVHFLYGSRPLKKYKATEKKWFGGKLGGHAGIEKDSGQVFSFVPAGKFHWFSKKNNRHSMYTNHSVKAFYEILGGDADSVKKVVVHIPVTYRQKFVLDSIAAAYQYRTPYDYALFGMRCGAATYDLLAQLDIMTRYSNSKTWKKIFYPKKLRKRLFRKAKQYNWLVEKTAGSAKRKWERD